MNTGTRLQRIREVAGAVWDIMAAAVLVLSAALTTILIVGTLHIFYKIW
jgi:hypothetical protein